MLLCFSLIAGDMISAQLHQAGALQSTAGPTSSAPQPVPKHPRHRHQQRERSTSAPNVCINLVNPGDLITPHFHHHQIGQHHHHHHHHVASGTQSAATMMTLPATTSSVAAAGGAIGGGEVGMVLISSQLYLPGLHRAFCLVIRRHRHRSSSSLLYVTRCSLHLLYVCFLNCFLLLILPSFQVKN